MKELTLKELADIGADAAFKFMDNSLLVIKDGNGWNYTKDEPARQAFAQAVKDAVLSNLVTKSDSLPEPKPEPVLVTLDINDIRATDEFKPIHGKTIYAPLFWDSQNVKTVRGFNTYEELATSYLRRQHGSNEWKPCTKESK